MGMFDAISGIFRSGASAIGAGLSSIGNFVTDFGGGAFAAIDETFRGGTLSPGMAATTGRRAGITAGGIFTDIGTSFITGQVNSLVGNVTAPERFVGGTFRTLPPPPRTAGQTFGEIIAKVQPPAGFTPQPEVFGPTARTIAPPRVVTARPPAIDPRSAVVIPQTAGFGDLIGLDDIITGLETNVLNPFGLGTAARSIGEIFSGGPPMATALPGGALLPRPQSLGGGLFRGTQNMTTGAMSVRPLKEIQAINPLTGRIHTWREKGRCLLWSDDLAAVKRVSRVARKARRKR